MTQGGLHRISFQFYEGHAMELRSHIEFMWAVNLQMINCLHNEDENLLSDIWKEFWVDGLAYASRFARYQLDYANQYLCRLISYYYVCIVKHRHSTEKEETGKNREDMDELLPVFKDIENMPILVLQSVSMLLSNGITWKDVMGGEHADFFAELFYKARELSLGQNKYE